MSDNTAAARPAETFAEAEDALLSRWPETKLEPSLDRIRAFTELLGEPQSVLPGHPPDRHQRQDLHQPDDRAPCCARSTCAPAASPARTSRG